MDDKMTLNAMRLLKYIPILFLFNSYWTLSNRQIFENIINKLDSSTTQMKSSHTLSSLWILRPTSPMLFFCAALTIIGVLRTFWPDKLK